MLVYEITNKVNDKSYIGVTTQSLRQRMNEHFARLDRKSGKNNHNYKHGNRIGQSKYHNLDGNLKERVAS